MKSIISIALLTIILNSCNVSPKKIQYGEQACHFCQMTIVDKQYAAQIMTRKGKTFNFDATECMINYISGIDTKTVALFLVTDYNRPETLIDARAATFVISEDLPSPMGANLSSVLTISEAETLLKNKIGKHYNWNELLTYLNNL